MNFCSINTALGVMGLGWTRAGISRVSLPDEPGAIRARFARYDEAKGDPDLIAQIIAYGAGERVAFSEVEVDLDGVPTFHRQVYEDIRQLAWGETTTYGDIARRLGDVQFSRAVGQALGRNPIPLIIPCHRVMAANDAIGGFSAPGGKSTKRKMLALENAVPPSGQYRFGF